MDLDFVSLVARLAEVELLELVECVSVLEEESFLADCVASELALLELFALCCDLLLFEESAFCAALLEAEFEAEFAFLAAFDAELTFDAELLAEADWSALLDVLLAVPELLVVELLADPPFDAERLLAPLPVVVEVAPLLEELLLKAEFPTEVELPSGAFALAVAPLELAEEVALLVALLVAAELSLDDADFTLLAFWALLEAEESVDEADLLAEFDADEVMEEVEFLLALAC